MKKSNKLCVLLYIIGLKAVTCQNTDTNETNDAMTTLPNFELETEAPSNRSFLIDYDENIFRMDGEPFKYVAGSIHYFRCPHQYWRDRLRAMRATGINAVTTYVEWSFHEPQYRDYHWTGDKDLVNFIKIAQEEDLYVILRPGPYICAERDMGGFPYWLLNRYPKIKLRTNDFDYKNEVRGWYSQLMAKIQPYLYGNGGPIIMVQVENEYGSFEACDKKYMAWLARLTMDWVQGAALLFTTDGNVDRMVRCGSTPGVYATIDFGTGVDVQRSWQVMRKHSPRGPLVNSEFYPGWLTHWGERAATVDADKIIKTMDQMMSDNASFNFYMFHGGTNFGFTAGANLSPNYVPDITSYDYDAPLTEAGDPTPKYFEIREKISHYLPMPDVPVPSIKPKLAYGPVKMQPFIMMLSGRGRKHMGKNRRFNKDPLTMEALDQDFGLVLYETILPEKETDPSLLAVSDLRDRAIIYVNHTLVGSMSRTRLVSSLPLMPAQGNSLQILVENQGRVNYMLANDFKGILGGVSVNGSPLVNWTMTSFPLDNLEWAFDNGRKPNDNYVPEKVHDSIERHPITSGILRDGPVLYTARVKFPDCSTLDTYIDMSGWGKGFVWMNNKNLGRYWPGEGPQVSVYLPGVYLNGEPDCTNTVAILEMQSAPKTLNINFIDKPKLGYKE